MKFNYYNAGRFASDCQCSANYHYDITHEQCVKVYNLAFFHAFFCGIDKTDCGCPLIERTICGKANSTLLKIAKDYKFSKEDNSL